MKRWFQLSILQMLVATAIVALFVIKNMEVRAAWHGTRSGYEHLIAGWPWIYWSEVNYIHGLEPLSQGEYRAWWALAVNVTCCLSACLLLLTVVSFFSKKT